MESVSMSSLREFYEISYSKMFRNESKTGRDYLLWTYTEPSTIHQFWFEKLDLEAELDWGLRNWPIPYISIIVYLVVIFAGQIWMKDRKPFQLQKQLVAWNFALAVFSAWAFIRTVPELVQILSSPNGFMRSVCVRENFNQSSGFYGWLFIWSKVAELGDTVFLILRRRPVIFLHWFHHMTVLMACWLTVFHFDPVARWFGVVNLFVHSVMYTYYTLRAMKYRVPQKVAMVITSMQIGQMVWAVYLNLYAIHKKSNGVECARSTAGIQIHFTLYFCYLVLFANYFYKAYVTPKSKKA